MPSGLPEFLDPWRCADSEAEFTGLLALARFPRLRGLLSEADGHVTFRLRFSRDLARRAVVRGDVRARLRLICQRCLGPLEHTVEETFTLALVQGLDEMHRLPDRYEPLLAVGEIVRPLELLEDEMLLALPQIPTHPVGECEPDGVSSTGAEGLDDEATGESRPFAVLAGWRGRSRD
jgi:uncharacterized protein